MLQEFFLLKDVCMYQKRVHSNSGLHTAHVLLYYSLSYSTHTDFLRVKSFESSIECTLHIKDSLLEYDGFYP